MPAAAAPALTTTDALALTGELPADVAGVAYDARHAVDVDWADLLGYIDPATTVCTDATCQAATSHRVTCRCSCGGTGHGADHTARRAAALAAHRARIAADGGIFGHLAKRGLVMDSDDGWWNEGPPVTSPRSRVVVRSFVLDDDDLPF